MPPKQRSLEQIDAKNKGAISSVVITARSLFLNRYLKVSFSGEMVGGNHILNWFTDTYIGTLGLTAATLGSWAGRRVLDVGSGINFFGTEASVLGIRVDRADLNLAQHENELYAENMAIFEEHHAPKIPKEYGSLFGEVFGKVKKICTEYPGDVAKTPTIDATNMFAIQSNTYDASVSVWMLAYLSGDQQKHVIREMIRVTRVGGEVRIYSGPSPSPYGVVSFLKDFEPDRRYSLKKHKVTKLAPVPKHGQFVISQKCVTVDHAQSNGAETLLVLKVGAYDPYYTSSISTALNIHSASVGIQCATCKAMHGVNASIFYNWHRCRVCRTIFCPTCGGKLANRRTTSWVSRERDCNREDCDGRTELI